MLDRKNMPHFLERLTAMDMVTAIRIDTNASWKTKPYGAVDKGKIVLMCTFHPTQVNKSRFLENARSYLEEGFSIGMVNCVIAGDDFSQYYEMRAELAEIGIPLHPNPLWGSNGIHSREALRLFNSELPDVDCYFRTGVGSPRGKRCFHPVVAYHLNQSGGISVGCHPERHGSFFSPNLPRTYEESPRCPSKSCVCLDMYSFLNDVNRNTSTDPLREYSKLLIRMRRPAIC